MKARYAEYLVPTSTITIDRERTYPGRKTRRSHARFNRPKSARSWHYPRSVDCIIATNDKQPEITGAYSRFLVDRSVCIYARSPARSENLFIRELLKPPTSPRFSWNTLQCAELSFR